MPVRRLNRALSALAAAAAGALVMSGCDGSAPANGPSANDPFATPALGVSLILKSTTNPFFRAMKAGAEEAAASTNIQLTVVASNGPGDAGTQVDAIAGAIARGDQGILITPDGPDVEAALVLARASGLYVVALDTPPSDPEAVDITFATNNTAAGDLLGRWVASELMGAPAVIALLGLADADVPTVDTFREQGFLSGMGIAIGDPSIKGDESASGYYSAGTYVIAGRGISEATRIGGRTALDEILAANGDVNVVYAINDEAAFGALQSLSDAGVTGAIVVAIDGSCEAVASVASGTMSADSQQFPLRMSQVGIQAISQAIRQGIYAEPTPGLDFVDTGVALVTDRPHEGIASIDTTTAATTCWEG